MTNKYNTNTKARLITGIVTFSSVVAARAADLTTTLHFNPSLSREANPLCSVFGFDAAQLVASNVIGVMIFVLVPLLIYIVYPPAKIKETAHTLGEYSSLQIFRSKLKRIRLLSGMFLGWPLPKNWLQATRVFGFAASWAIVFGSLQATFAWWATNQWGMDWYKDYRGIINFYNYPVIELIPVGIVFYLMGYLFFRKEFNIYKIQMSNKSE